jgi:hypothetical protein
MGILPQCGETKDGPACPDFITHDVRMNEPENPDLGLLIRRIKRTIVDGRRVAGGVILVQLYLKRYEYWFNVRYA